MILQQVSKVFEGGVRAIDDVSLNIAEGEFVAIVGSSGCGKSTLLRIMAGLLPVTSGKVTRESDNIGFVFQDPTLLDWASVFDNIWLPLRLKGMSRDEARSKIMGYITRLGLLGFENMKPPSLSGGMKMRVSLARALITSPAILLMDEPFAALDEITRFKLNDDLRALHRSEKPTIVFVTHSIYEAVNLASRVIVLSPRPAKLVGEVVIAAEKSADFRHSTAFTGYTKQVSDMLEQG